MASINYGKPPGNSDGLNFEAQLWAAADKMRGHMDASEYKHVCLGLIFLKYISDAFEEKREQLHRNYLVRLKEYAGFTDIEFNPEKSVNCQARSCAIFVEMMTKDILEVAIKSPGSFIEAVTPDSFAQPHSSDSAQGKLL